MLSAPAFAAYTVYLKNGSVIHGVQRYEKGGGEIMLFLSVGTVGVPEKDILKIEKTGDEVSPPEETSAEEPAPEAKPPQTQEKGVSPERQRIIADLKKRIQEIDKRFEELKKKDGEAKAIEKELTEVNFTVEVLFQKGVANARAAGAPDAQWFLYLSPQEREWSKVNLLRQGELKIKIEESKNVLKDTERERTFLMNEKRSLENQIMTLSR